MARINDKFIELGLEKGPGGVNDGKEGGSWMRKVAPADFPSCSFLLLVVVITVFYMSVRAQGTPSHHRPQVGSYDCNLIAQS